MIIALTGFMGCGKSTVAQLLAAQKGCFFFDLDDTIQMGEGMSIAEIFAQQGEGGFRILEYEYLSNIFEDYKGFPEPIVISLGGGTLLTDQCAKIVKDNAFCIYLKASNDILIDNLRITGVQDRPLLDEDRLQAQVGELMAVRGPIYESRSDVTLDIDGLSSEQIAETICRKWLKR